MRNVSGEATADAGEEAKTEVMVDKISATSVWKWTASETIERRRERRGMRELKEREGEENKSCVAEVDGAAAKEGE